MIKSFTDLNLRPCYLEILGLVRKQAIATVNAYAYVIPGFLLILLGGINSPFWWGDKQIKSETGCGV